MKSAWDADNRRELQQRVLALRPETQGQWGRMTAPQMVAHLADSLRMALGDIPVAAKKSPIRYPPLKQLLICWLPFPKGVPTPVAALLWSSLFLFKPDETALIVMALTLAVAMNVPVRIARPASAGLALFILWPAALIVAHASRW